MQEKLEEQPQPEPQEEVKKEVRVIEYKIKGHKYEMMNLDDKGMRDEFLRNGFHCVSLKMDKDPVNGLLNGVFLIRLRMSEQKQVEFEDFLVFRGMQLCNKKII